MIKLTLNPEMEARSHTFDKQEVILGSGDSTLADFAIPGDTVQSMHVKIIKEESRFVVINVANDPFTSLKGLPFGKKTINNHDTLEIGNHTILFEISTTPEDSSTPTDPDGDQFTKEELASIDIDALVKEVEDFEHQLPTPPDEAQAPSELPKQSPSEETSSDAPPEKNQPQPPFEAEPLSIPSKETPKPKMYYLQDFDDETETWNQDTEGFQIQDPKKTAIENWKMIIGLIVAIIILSGIICSGVYFRASGKNSQEEKKIAAGITDIAMAITHAQLNHITPNKLNWSDPDFIRNNLAQVLAPNLHTQAQIDTKGQFHKYPYILRVYTSDDLSRFLIIAQPAPNLLQWLIHKKTIVIDSTAMEMRKITDLKELNRLLTNPTPLEGNSGLEISRTIKEGKLMPLDSLAGNKNHWGFISPKTLGYIRPGAENYIYNAPRFYPFGETLLNRAINLHMNPSSSEDVSELQEDMSEISKFPDIVLYTSLGLQNAIDAQKALTTFTPNSKFLVGYVKLNPKGYVASSHLLMHEDNAEISMLESDALFPHHLSGKPLRTNSFETDDFEQLFSFENTDHDSDISVERNHPLYLQLHAVATERLHALKPISNEIITLLQKQHNEILPDFETNIQDLVHEYIQTGHEQRTKMIEELANLYLEYSDMPLEEFMQFISATKLTPLIDEALEEHNRTPETMTLDENQIEEQFQKIHSAQTLANLNDNTQETAKMLSLGKLSDTENLINYQILLHNKVLDKLSQFLLSPNTPYAHNNFNNQDRTTLIQVLKNSWVTDHDEYKYFLSEFDHRRKEG
ncbi:MAG: hypothetical protein K940chlam7_00495 [Chlamydiae bacterium]|nr:hypothetical protein [Chlamydiota bacterium]